MSNTVTNYSSPHMSHANSGIVEPSNAASNPHIINDHLERVKKSQVILEKYPDRVPLIIQPSMNDRDAYPIDKSKYITPRELTLMQLQQIIRKRIRFPAQNALYLFINNKIYPITSLIGTIYDENKDSDGFLYVTYCQESTFGNYTLEDVKRHFESSRV
jgi:GABA(A) receptor-associated protein